MEDNIKVEPRFSWIYRKDTPYGITFESILSRITEGILNKIKLLKTALLVYWLDQLLRFFL